MTTSLSYPLGYYRMPVLRIHDSYANQGWVKAWGKTLS